MYSVKEKKVKIPIEIGIEAGDLANEIGKYFMKDVQEYISKYEGIGEKFYFLTSTRKDPTDSKKIIHYFYPCLEKNGQIFKPKKMYENMTLWEMNYKTKKLKDIWSLPHRTEMKNFLRKSEKYSKNIIDSIKTYIKQEKINLNDSRSQIILS